MKLSAGGGDGSTIDAKGRLYVTSGAGVEVIDPSGKRLGVIPTPRGVITCAFGGKNKKTLFILARGVHDLEGRGARQRRAGVDDSDGGTGLQRSRQVEVNVHSRRDAEVGERLLKWRRGYEDLCVL